MKIAFSFFLLIYSRCGAPASWAARHTIVCLDNTLSVNFTDPIVALSKSSQDPEDIISLDNSDNSHLVSTCTPAKIQETECSGHKYPPPCVIKVINIKPATYLKNALHILVIIANAVVQPGIIAKQQFHCLPSCNLVCKGAPQSDCSCHISANNIIETPNKCHLVFNALLIISYNADKSCKSTLNHIYSICLFQDFNKKCIYRSKHLEANLAIDTITRTFTQDSSICKVITGKFTLVKGIIKVGNSYCDPKILGFCIHEAMYVRIVLYLWQQDVLTKDCSSCSTFIPKTMLPITGLYTSITTVLPHIECSGTTCGNLQSMHLLPTKARIVTYTVKNTFWFYDKTALMHILYFLEKCFIDTLSFSESIPVEVKTCLYELPQELPPKLPKESPLKLPPYAPARVPFFEKPVLKRRRITPFYTSSKNPPVAYSHNNVL